MTHLLTLWVIASSTLYTVGRNLKLYDMSHELNVNSPYWPGNPSLNFTILNRYQNPLGFWYESNWISSSEHGSTHLDAPAHFSKGKWRVHQIPLEKLCGPGVIIDVSSKADSDYDYLVTVQDIKDWEKTNGRIPEGAVVIMNSGWTRRHPDNNLIFGSETLGNTSTFHFPGWHPDAVQWLVEKRRINMFGVDTPSVDHGQSKTFRSHIVAGLANLPGLENVKITAGIPAAGTIIYAAAVKLFDGSGIPVRIFATFDSPAISAGAKFLNVPLFLFMVITYKLL